MPDIETWIDFDADVTVQSFAAREIDIRAARFGVYRPGVFDFADGTVQGWSLDQLYDSSDPTLTPLKAFPAPPGGPGAAAFTLSNSQNRALAASASLLLADPTVKQLDFYFQSPDLSKREGWDKAGGYRIDLRREFFSKCLDKPELFAVQLQAQFWDLEASKLRTYAEYDDATGKFLFHRSALGELEAAARLALAVLLALDDAGVAGQETGGLQRGAQRRIVERQRLGDAVLDRAGLARQPAALDGRLDVELAGDIGHGEGLGDHHLQHGPGEILRHFLAVDAHLAGAGLDPDAGDGVLALAGGVAAAVLVADGLLRRGVGVFLRRDRDGVLKVFEGTDVVGHALRRSGCSWGSWRRRRWSPAAAPHAGARRRRRCADASAAAGERAARHHALHGLVDHALGVLALEDLRRGAGLDAARIAGVPVIDLVGRLLPVIWILSAFTTITLSPISMCGVKDGLCLPRRRVAMKAASRPSTMPSASITSHFLSMSAGFAL
jgi:hypothetical protein